MDGNINREHKDRLFTFIFGREENKSWTLELYNAVNGSHHDNPEEIEFNTIGEAMYMGMKNDVSFILHNEVNLYEQQSTFNPNMPVRQLMYLGRMYDRYIQEHDLSIFSSCQIELPVPRLVTFYNGLEDSSDRILRLRDAFGEDAEKSDVSVSVHMINVNYGHNKKLLEACRPLSEYSWLINRIRTNRRYMEIGEAVDAAIDEMPQEFVIRKFLIGNRAEVKNMCLTEYDEEKTWEIIKRDFLREGRKEGIKEGQSSLADSIKRLKAGETEKDLLASGVDDETVRLALSCM